MQDLRQPPTIAITPAARAQLQAAIDDLGPRLRDLPVIARMRAGAERRRLAAVMDDQLTGIVHHMRRRHGARIALGGRLQRIVIAGVGVETPSGTARLLRLWLARAEGRVRP